MLKSDFVSNLNYFCISTGIFEGISCLKYHKTEHDEFVYVIYKTGDQKRFCVTGDSNKAIFHDFNIFLSNHDKYKWLDDSEKI